MPLVFRTPVCKMDLTFESADQTNETQSPVEERRPCIDLGLESRFPVLDFSPFVRLPPIVKGKRHLTNSEQTMTAIKSNVSATTRSKFDQLRPCHNQNKESLLTGKSPKGLTDFSIDKTRFERESMKEKFVQNRQSLRKYFPHLEKSPDTSEKYETPSMLQNDDSCWRTCQLQAVLRPQELKSGSRYQRSTTAPPRLNKSSVSAIGDNIDLSAIDLVSIANEQEYQAMSNERHRCVSRTMRCHSAKTIYPDLAMFHSAPYYTNCRFESELKRKPCAREIPVQGEGRIIKPNALAMEWCDVLGPKHCYNCDKVHKRNHYGTLNESNYDTIGINTENLSTLTLVKRLIPDMDVRDIQYNIADGNILTGELKREKLSERRKSSTIDKPTKKGLSRRRISAFGIPDGLGFFLNFSDLRSQMLAEEKKKKASKGATFDVTEYLTIPNAEVDIEVVDSSEKHYSNYFSPPLLSISACSQPSFYAGGDNKYQLPKAPTTSILRQRASEAMVEMEASSVVKQEEIDETDQQEPSINTIQNSPAWSSTNVGCS